MTKVRRATTSGWTIIPKVGLYICKVAAIVAPKRPAFNVGRPVHIWCHQATGRNWKQVSTHSRLYPKLLNFNQKLVRHIRTCVRLNARCQLRLWMLINVPDKLAPANARVNPAMARQTNRHWRHHLVPSDNQCWFEIALFLSRSRQVLSPCKGHRHAQLTTLSVHLMKIKLKSPLFVD